MSIQILRDARPHPARDIAIRSIECAEQKDRAGWLALWDDDGVVEDPVGISPLDPSGEGHRGIDSIAAFYDAAIAVSDLRFCIRQTFACGSECANVGTITVRSENGMVSRTELVMVYRLTPDGKLASMRAFWEFEKTVTGIF